MKIFINDGKGQREIALEELLSMTKDPDIARLGFRDNSMASILGTGRMQDGLQFPNRIKMRALDFKGDLKWEEEFSNLVTNVGLQHILDVMFLSATSQMSPWYVGLINDNSAAFDLVAIDTMASHGTWTEDVTYSDTYRQEYVDVRSAESVSNTASTADFSINGTTIIAGAFLAGKRGKSASGGILLCGGAFSGGERSVINGDTLQVTYTFTAADDGV